MSRFVELNNTPVDLNHFVSHWQRFYADDDKLYLDNIRNGFHITTDCLIALMKWKAQGRFPERYKAFAKAIPPN